MDNSALLGKKEPEGIENQVAKKLKPLRHFSRMEMEFCKSNDGTDIELGKGARGRIFKGLISAEKSLVAIKDFRKTTREEIETEAAMTSRASGHENVIDIIGVVDKNLQDWESPWILLEYVDKGVDLKRLIQSNTGLDERTCVRILIDMCRALEYVHTHSIRHQILGRDMIHMDIAARNILVVQLASNEIGRSILIDFGLGKMLDANGNYRGELNERFDRRWAAPESLETRMWTTKSDVYSFGVLVWELFVEDKEMLPHAALDTDAEILEFLSSKNHLDFPEAADGTIIHSMKSIALRCWEINPKERPSIVEVRELLSAIDIGQPMK